MLLHAWGPGFGQQSFDAQCLAARMLLDVSDTAFETVLCRDALVSHTGELPVLQAGIARSAAVAGDCHTCSKSASVAGDYSACSKSIAASRDNISGPSSASRDTNGTCGLAAIAAGVGLDCSLSATQRAHSAAFASLVANTVGDALLHTWWVQEGNSEHSHRTVTAQMGFLQRRAAFAAARARARVRLSGHGCLQVADRMVPEVYIRAHDAFAALSTKLGSKLFFFGDTPTSLDCIVYGYVSLAAYPALATPELFTMLSFEFPTLLAFLERMKVFIKPLVISPTSRPRLHIIVADILKNPSPYFEYMWLGANTKLVESDSEKEKARELRIERFWSSVSAASAIAIFTSFVINSGIKS